MKTRTEILQQIEQTIRTEWFKDHQLVEHNIGPGDYVNNGIESFQWSKPDSGTYRVDYILFSGRLIVTGDLGCAVYEFGGPITIAALAECSANYMADKCVASEWGKNPLMWDIHAAAYDLREYMREVIANRNYEKGDDRPVDERALESTMMAVPSFTDREAFLRWNRSHRFCPDGMEHCGTPVGMIVPPRIVGHFVGMKMIAEQWQRERDQVRALTTPSGDSAITDGPIVMAGGPGGTQVQIHVIEPIATNTIKP